MIIKSMTRKTPSFGQLVAYMDSEKAAGSYTVYHNLYARQPEDVTAEFEENAAFLRKRKNGVYLYHEVLSITRADGISEQEQKALFRELAIHYAQTRAGQNMIFAVMHDDKDHNLHYHFLISSNAVGDSRRMRLSRADFDRFKKDFEKRVLEHYPQLEQKVIIQRQAEAKLSNSGAELKRRTGKTPQRDEVKARLHSVFEQTTDKQSFFSALQAQGFEVYVRGKTFGVLDLQSGRKHRLKTLGMLDEFERVNRLIEIEEQVKQAAKAQVEPDAPQDQKADQASQDPCDSEADSEQSAPESKAADPNESQADNGGKDEAELSTEAKREKIIQERQQEIKQRRESEKNQTRKNEKSDKQ